MGIYDREYYRDEGGGWGGWGSGKATRWLVGITVGVWLAQLFTRGAAWGGVGIPGLTGVNALGAFIPDRILQGEVWRLVTPFFCNHDRDLLGVIFGMLILYWVGTQLEERYGTREFLAFYLLAGVIAHTAYLLVLVAGLAPPWVVLGSNPTVNAAFILYAFINPRAIILLFFVLPVPIWLVATAYVAFSVLGTIAGAGGAFVALAGAAFGAIYYVSGLRLTGWSFGGGGGRRARTQPRLRVVPSDEQDESGDTDEPPAPRPQEERFEERVDRVLEKVSRHGQESLSPEERELLFRAGEHYKKRRR